MPSNSPGNHDKAPRKVRLRQGDSTYAVFERPVNAPSHGPARARVYQQALSELRDNHLVEFEVIRKRMMLEAGLEVREIDPGSIKMELLRRIHSAHQSATRFPSLTTLGREFKVSSETIRRWITELRKDGFVKRIDGPGYRFESTRKGKALLAGEE